MIHISLAGETLFHLGPLAVTNTLLTTWIVMGVIIIASKLILSSYSPKPTRAQIVLEEIVGMLYNMFTSILGKNTRKFFPLLATIFIFIILSNWSGLLPGVGSIGIKEEVAVSQAERHDSPEEKTKAFDVPLFRAPTADLNTTFALAIIGMTMLQYWGMQMLGSVTYLTKFFTFKDPISAFVGILELISELGKVISFAFRLFGNIFAGEVLLVIIGSLIPLIVPLPFLGLEIFVGFVQALVFSMLLAVFLSIATVEAHH
jgi:F-type H+-transporting ATPase subunit a